jgi:hypothetical protein
MYLNDLRVVAVARDRCPAWGQMQRAPTKMGFCCLAVKTPMFLPGLTQSAKVGYPELANCNQPSALAHNSQHLQL